MKETGGCLVLFVWLFTLLLSLGFTGVMIWAIVRVVLHFT